MAPRGDVMHYTSGLCKDRKARVLGILRPRRRSVTARRPTAEEPRSTEGQTRRKQIDCSTAHHVTRDRDPILVFVGRPLLDRMRHVAWPHQHAALFRGNNDKIGV